VKVQDAADMPTDTGLKMKKTIIGFFDAEYVCHREGMKHRDKIEQIWNPLIRWFESYYGTTLKVFDGELFAPDPTQYDARSSFVTKYSTKNADFTDKNNILFDLKVVLDKLQPWELVALHGLVETTESAIISLALFHGEINYEQAILATQWPLLEQTAQHGIVMGDHDVMIAEQRLKIASLALFMKLYRIKDK
jgi:chaperone required for assembly of F1-ATPase